MFNALFHVGNFQRVKGDFHSWGRRDFCVCFGAPRPTWVPGSSSTANSVLSSCLSITTILCSSKLTLGYPNLALSTKSLPSLYVWGGTQRNFIILIMNKQTNQHKTKMLHILKLPYGSNFRCCGMYCLSVISTKLVTDVLESSSPSLRRWDRRLPRVHWPGSLADSVFL